MAQYVKQGNIFGRIGTGIGKGLAEQGQKEIERSRLASGLKELGEKKDLNPFQQFSKLAGIPGITPQMIQSGSELLRQQAYLNGIKNQYQGQEGAKNERKGYVPTEEELSQPLRGEIPTLATPEDTAQSYKTFIPPTEQEERKDAFQNFNKNPARYEYDYNKALEERKAITSRNKEIQQAQQLQEKTAIGKEETLKKALDNEAKRLGIIPIGDKDNKANFDPTLYQDFEEKIINSILPKAKKGETGGGEGLTQEAAIKKYSDQLLTAYENYKNLETLSAWSPKEFNRKADAIQNNLSPLGERANRMMMNKLISDYQVSPLYAAHKAYPIQKGQVPILNKLGIQTGASSNRSGFSLPEMNNATYAELKKQMGNTHSPLSIAYELQKKSQDPRGWLDYLDKHRDHLEVWQANELGKNINVFDLKDKWLAAWE